jgi:uncharacterized protein (UPF0264 family)
MDRIRIPAVLSARPKLLVSVRHAAEAMSALRGGADIIDVKEPSHGSLGRASVLAVMSIAQCVSTHRVETRQGVGKVPDGDSRESPLSVALGELTEWMTGNDAWSDDFVAALSRVGRGFLKLGLAGLFRDDVASAAWIDQWLQVRRRISRDSNWVAVAYADHVRAESPSVEAVCAAAVKTGCRVLLIDTFKKDRSGLLDFMTLDQLHAIRTTSAAEGLRLALAGQVTAHHLERLLPISPDIIAVRGAVCEGGHRTAAVSESKVRAFLEALEAATSSVTDPTLPRDSFTAQPQAPA